MLMDYDVEILHGWPDGQAIQSVETIKVGSTLNNGDFVEFQSDGTVDKVGNTKTAFAGVVMRGNGDAKDALNTGKAVVIWTNFIMRVKNTKYKTASTYASGTKITVGGSANNGMLDADAGSDPTFGYVMKVVAATATDDASLIVLVK